MRAWRFFSPAGVLRALFGVALLAWVLSRLELRTELLRHAAAWVALFSLFPFVGACVEALRLRGLFRAQDMHLPVWLGVRLVLIAFAFNLCIPGGTGGDLVKLYYLASANAGRRVEIGALVLLDRVLALLSLLLAAALAAAISWRHTEHLPAVRALGLLSLAAVAAGTVMLALGVAFGARGAAHLQPRGRIGAFAARLLAVLARYRGRTAALASAVAITLAGNGLLLALHAGAARALLGASDLGTSAALASLGMVANALPLTPGGIGVGEAAFEQLFSLIGVTGGAVLALAWRLGALPACAVGFVMYGIGVHADERALAEVAEESGRA